jgi:hypothetical protein
MTRHNPATPGCALSVSIAIPMLLLGGAVVVSEARTAG